MPGGVIPPDGRPTQAPGVGKDAKRHDLEGTPGLHNSSLQQGDVAMLEEGQRQFKRVQRPAVPTESRSAAPAQTVDPRADAPDPIQFIGGRATGTFNPSTVGQGPSKFDVEAWAPFMRRVASDPTASGPLTASLMAQLANVQNQAREAHVTIIDANAAEDAVGLSIS